MASMMATTLGSRAAPNLSSRPAPRRPNPARYGRQGATSGAVFSSSLRCTPASSFTHPEPGKRLHTSFLLLERKSQPSSPHVISGSSTSGSLELADGEGGNPGQGGGEGGGGGGGGGGDDGKGDGFGDNNYDDAGKAGLLEALRRGWRRRVRADPQFAFKVFSEAVIGVAACVLGDMASRPNFGLNELDFVFSTIVVGSILNFTLMYMLAPTAAAGQASQQLPLLFAACPPGHMFEAGNYSLLDRAGTFVYKGVQFAAVGFVAGLAGTALSNLLLAIRKKVDPKFEIQNKSPPTVLNALTWAGHMGLSSNARYQTLNGLEFALAGVLHPTAFKSAVFVLRGLNNVCGGVTFVMLARKTGSQSAPAPTPAASDVSTSEAKQGLLLAEQTI